MHYARDAFRRDARIEVQEFVLPTAVALGLGLLIGAERERAKGTDPIERSRAFARSLSSACLACSAH